MSLITSSNILNKETQKSFLSTIVSKISIRVAISTIALATLAFSMTGCNTTQPLKPTASIMVGAHKSL